MTTRFVFSMKIVLNFFIDIVISQKNNHPKITNYESHKTCFYFTRCDLIINCQKLPKFYFQSQFVMTSNDFDLRKLDQGINFVT